MISVILVSLSVSYLLGFIAQAVLKSTSFYPALHRLSFSLWICLSILISCFLVHYEIQNMFALMTQRAENLALQSGNVEPLLLQFLDQFIFKLILILALPFVFYGFYFADVLKNNSSRLWTVLKIEVAALVVGNATTVLVLPVVGWYGLFTILIGLFVSAWLLQKKTRVDFLIVGLIVSVLVFCPQYLKPSSNLRFAAKDFTAKLSLRLLRESWNIHSRVRSVEIRDPEKKTKTKKIIVLGEGVGIARMPAPLQSPLLTIDFVKVFSPRDLLILFAGGGAELNAVKQSPLDASVQSVVGVELNSDVIAHARLESDGALDATLRDSRYQMVHADARIFLERDSAKYDLILFSWSGATMAHYSGALIHTTQYVFTREAIKAAIERLKPNGKLILLGASKTNLLMHFRALGITDLKQKIILLEPTENGEWRKVWDDHMLIFSNSPLTDKENIYEELKAVAQEHDYRIVIQPGFETDTNYQFHQRLIESEDWLSVANDFAKSSGLIFQSHDDDRPFVYNLKSYFSFSSRQEILKTVRSFTSFQQGLTLMNAVFLVVVVIFLYIIFLKLRGDTMTNDATVLPFGCGFVGGLFHFIFTYKTSLYFGLPSLVLSLNFIFFGVTTYISLLCCESHFFKRKNFITLLGASSFLLLVIYYFLDKIEFTHFLFHTSFTLKVLWFFVFFGPVMVINSYFYNGLLYRFQNDPLKIEKTIVFDVLGGCLAVLLAPFLVNDYGISFTLVLTSVITVTLFSGFVKGRITS